VDACNPLLQAHPTWARDEHEGRGIPISLTPVSGRLALPPSRSPSRSTHLGWGTRRHSLVGSGTPRSRNADRYERKEGKVFFAFGSKATSIGFIHNKAVGTRMKGKKHYKVFTNNYNSVHIQLQFSDK
jgi:hypothetical protein